MCYFQMAAHQGPRAMEGHPSGHQPRPCVPAETAFSGGRGGGPDQDVQGQAQAAPVPQAVPDKTERGLSLPKRVRTSQER